jgi:sensor histidine kinase YesM
MVSLRIMMAKSFKNYFTIAFFLSLAIGITIHFPMVMNFLFGEGDGDRRHGGQLMVSFSHLGTEMFITCLVAFLMFTLNYFILKPTEKHVKVKTLTIILSVFLTLIVVSILNHLFYSLMSMLDAGPRSRGSQDEFIFRNFFVSGLVVGCILIIRLIYQKQSIQIENETLKSEALQSQFESLKNQLSPHFLFNSLTALKTLINEAPDIAQNYINNLSKALRYTLQSNEKKLVTLKEELDFTESYLFLLKLRFDTNLTVVIESDEKYSGHRLPPLTVQTLVENAVKHNEVSKRKPLTITIETTSKASLAVRNNIQVKITEEEGTGIGLTNLSKQFQLLLGKEIGISNENNEFIVEVPLINP